MTESFNRIAIDRPENEILKYSQYFSNLMNLYDKKKKKNDKINLTGANIYFCIRSSAVYTAEYHWRGTFQTWDWDRILKNRLIDTDHELSDKMSF